ncbi:endonuclease/exonuclease/phosphatase family protein [Aureibacter tunicatorum]|uniref:Endonuclease/exonuclease/phosphatase family metal-dependent hydrolase n=1 Tax=Aureibacter tunicatorum TaxID=866807 RepID=A0AAE4BTR1_9BACT|nr:endonuclease/exonuclease/phosphatase family protein [Aureibacter tunicatorum]MDR6240058.1 endonuclease/exonuclease/phosphatase family metal-dependent hydrolase [Aureibacter tunicatorum]BDD04530.1 endonuclease [Aureibacter tunicatorum]
MRVATFNIENLDNKPDEKNPSLAQRAPVLKKELERINADIICIQEVHGQETINHTVENPERNLSALDYVIKGTKYEDYKRAYTTTAEGMPRDKRNLVILSAYEILEFYQYRNSYISKLKYLPITADEGGDEVKNVMWERPILHAKVKLPNDEIIHVINVHFKSKLSSNISGQKVGFGWKSSAGWAEGYFLSSIKRVGQALETRILVDKIFDNDPDANILICGDFNAEPGTVPVEAIQGRTENTNNSELNSRVLVSCSRSIAESIRFSHLHHGHGNLLDHILVSRSLFQYFNKAEIFNEMLHDESLPFAYDTKYPEADHAPFIATFNIQF